MNRQRFTLSALLLVVLAIYLFVTAPPPLDEADSGGRSVPIERALAIVAAENDIARTLYTQEIVGKGSRAGLSFSEEWRSDGVEAGPLPALFLREAAASLDRSPVPLGLFLGSDFPISPANRFSGVQSEKFETIKRTRQPEFFYAGDTELHTAMFPDFASAAPCVTCHNEHRESPKTDWVLNDVMGATTWSYPRASVPPEELLAIVAAVRNGFRDAYGAYVERARSFAGPPEIGEKWPEDGYYLPSVEVFLAEFARRSSSSTLDRLIEAAEGADD